ncbi:hypothetical protein ACIP1X_27365, partial [Pseudomonas sp. NPDC088885]|uniref:hypothetical protein n=1 Tax=Pseudomonas sp. NPDC088885 TaxID=3364457 RepID=UPI00382C76A9
SALRAQDASWQQQDQASGFLNNQAGQIAAFWRCPCPTGKARHVTKHRQPDLCAPAPLKPGLLPNLL